MQNDEGSLVKFVDSTSNPEGIIRLAHFVTCDDDSYAFKVNCAPSFSREDFCRGSRVLGAKTHCAISITCNRMLAHRPVDVLVGLGETLRRLS